MPSPAIRCPHPHGIAVDQSLATSTSLISAADSTLPILRLTPAARRSPPRRWDRGDHSASAVGITGRRHTVYAFRQRTLAASLRRPFPRSYAFTPPAPTRSARRFPSTSTIRAYNPDRQRLGRQHLLPGRDHEHGEEIHRIGDRGNSGGVLLHRHRLRLDCAQRASAAAVDSAGNVYVADTGNGRIVKFNSDGSFNSVFYTGASNESGGRHLTGHGLVAGDDGSGWHVTALRFLGAVVGDIPPRLFTALDRQQPLLAVNPTTETLYVVARYSRASSHVFMFNILPAPTAATGSAIQPRRHHGDAGATVNPKGQISNDCHLEYTDDADFQANAWTNAQSRTAIRSRSTSPPTSRSRRRHRPHCR